MDKKQAPQVTLPMGALAGARFEAFTPAATGAGSGGALQPTGLAPSPSAQMVTGSPTAMPMCTPSNVATTVWRTYVCPSAPARRQGDSLFGSPTSSIAAAHSPAADGFRTAALLGGPLWQGRPGSAPPGEDFAVCRQPSITSMSSNGSLNGSVQMPVCTPSDAATTAWRTAQCPDAPMRKTVPHSFPVMTPSATPVAATKANPVNLFPGSAAGTPMHGVEATGSPLAFPGSGGSQSGILFMPEPRRPGRRPSYIRTAFDSAPSPASGTPANNPLNTAFIGTPGSRGGYHVAMDPKSPFFGADATPVAASRPSGSPSMTGAVWAQVFPSGSPTYIPEGTKGTGSLDMDMAVEASPGNVWGQLGA